MHSLRSPRRISVLVFATTMLVAAGMPARGARAQQPAAGAAARPGAETAPAAISQGDLLRRVIDLKRLMLAPNGEKTGMFSSYDRRSRIENGEFIDWDANADYGNFIREEADGWQLMAELDGPGALTRIWSANPAGTIRFELDGRVALETEFGNLFTGKLPPFAEPLCYITPGNGHNCYFPMGFGQSCRVLAKECKSYYQINYVLFPQGTRVQTFRRILDASANAALELVNSALVNGLAERQLVGDGRTYRLGEQADLKPGGKLLAETFPGGGIVRVLNVAVTDRVLPRAPYALHRCVLRIYFDGEEQPSVEAPLVDFFGSGFHMHRFRSLACGTDHFSEIPTEVANESRFMYCNFPMPYSNGARFEIENLSEQRIGLMLLARVERITPPAEALRFKARYRREDPAKDLDLPILRTLGAGRIVGVVLNVDCPRQMWWGEGDDKVWLEREEFPTYFGTGSEDYIGDAWGFHKHTRPLQGVTRVNPFGKQSAYRWHVPDCINFETACKFTIENWQFGKEQDTYYGTLCYWYGEPEAKHHFQPLTLAELTPPGLRIPNAVEIEKHIASAEWGSLISERNADGVELSGQAAASVTTDQPITVVLPSERKRKVRLGLRVHPHRPFTTIEVRGPGGQPVGTVTYDYQARGLYTIGDVWLEAGDNELAVICASNAVLDCWMLADAAETAAELFGPGAVEAEELTRSGSEQVDAVVQEIVALTGGAHVWCRPKQAGEWVEFEVPAPAGPGEYRLSAVYTTSWDYGVLQTYVDGQKVGQRIDTFGNLARGPLRLLGVVRVAGETARMRVEVVEKSEKSPGYYFGVDAFVLEAAESK